MPAGRKRGTFGSATVVGAPGRDVYVNRKYRRPVGKTNQPLLVDLGGNRFETLNGAGEIDGRAEGTATAHTPNITVMLVPVSPPEKRATPSGRTVPPAKRAEPTGAAPTPKPRRG